MEKTTEASDPMGMPPGGLRTARFDDLEALVDLRIRAMQPGLDAAGRFDPARAQARLTDNFLQGPAWLSADPCGTPRGFVQWTREPGRVRVQHLYVEPSCQGRGLGGQLLDMAKETAETAGLPLGLETLKGSRAESFYKAHGFHRTGESEWDSHWEYLPGLLLRDWRQVTREAWEEYVAAWAAAGETPIPSATVKPGKDWDAMNAHWEHNETDEAWKTFVPYFMRFLTDPEGRILGAAGLRPALNDALLTTGGNVGYGIRPGERGNGLATRMLGMVLDRFRYPDTPGLARFGCPDRILVTCNDANTASARVMEKNGGVMEDRREVDGVMERRCWIRVLDA